MKRLTTTLAASLAALAASAGSAFAAGPPVQSATQSSGTDQAAISASSATQVNPSNQNISVRVLSPGSDGNVTQSNNATSTATAANTAGTTQNATQLQGGGCGCQLTPVQQILQDTANGQLGGVLSAAQQLGASNAAAPSSVASPSGSGDPISQSSTAAPSTDSPAVAPSGDTQSNSAASTGSATNAAPTGQTASQTQGGSGVQSADQQAQTDQAASAGSSTKQVDPSNSNISVRVLSPGSDGNVTQSNNATSTANASNTGSTTQSGKQIQSGSGSGVQSATQNADTQQLAGAASSAQQIDPSNSNISVRVLSPGSDGNVTQSNTDTSTASATNSAPVTQTAFQDPSGQAPSPSCGCGGQGGQDVQSITQGSWIGQIGDAQSSAEQVGASNSNDPVRVGSDGGGGNVTQSNTDSSTASASNTAPVSQNGMQTQSDPPSRSCGCGGGSDPSVQALGQSSWIGQGAQALSSADQVGATNSNDPVRVWSDGGGGNVTQSNTDTSTATATNTAPVSQTGTQVQSGSPCGCSGGPAVQALGQDSWTGQLSGAASSALQVGATNTADPVRIWSDGNDGNLTQSNAATSTATAANTGMTTQLGSQSQSGSGVQALAQKAATLQASLAESSATQLPGEKTCGCGGSSGSFGNEAGPIRIGSDGSDGNATQSNTATSTASAPNQASTNQGAWQTQSGSRCGCGGLGVQALGQEAFTGQLSKALSSTWQIGAKNASDPIRVWSFGGGGGMTGQTNGATSQASSPNTAGTGQNSSQAMIGAPIKI
jgi:hypothetical protein